MADCENCDHAYRRSFVDIIAGCGNGKAAVYDLDLVLEVEGRIVALMEYKRYKKRYPAYYVPFFEYVALKKFAKILRVTPYIIIETVQGGSVFHVFKVDRFEYSRGATTFSQGGRKFAIFDTAEGLEMDNTDFREFVANIARGA